MNIFCSADSGKKPTMVVWELLRRIRDRVADIDGRDGQLEKHTIAQQRTFEVVLTHYPDGILLKDLARIRGITAGAASVAVSALEACGMVRRAAVDGDRRATLLLPTEKSLKKGEKLDALTAEVTEEALRGVPAEDRETCFRVLRKMLENLNGS